MCNKSVTFDWLDEKKKGSELAKTLLSLLTSNMDNYIKVVEVINSVKDFTFSFYVLERRERKKKRRIYPNRTQINEEKKKDKRKISFEEKSDALEGDMVNGIVNAHNSAEKVLYSYVKFVQQLYLRNYA